MDRIYIRADANKQIGTGHVMRCLSIADCITEKEVVFIVADKCSETLIHEKGYSTICLETIWNDLESEIEVLKRVIEENKIERLLIDDYFVTEFYLLEIGKLVEIYYIDDINQFLYPVSTLINYNIYAKDMNYEERYEKQKVKTRFLLGTEYAPLREEFQEIKERTFEGVRKILITSGGTDNYNMIGSILERMEKEKDFLFYQFYCVIGRFNRNKDALLKKFETYENVHLLYNISNMSDYMRTCDVCITAGGSTIYELCACGTPSVLFSLADNQLDCAKKVSEIELIPWVGDARTDIRMCLDNIVKEIKKYNNLSYWETISCRMQKLVDGKGARRIAEELVRCKIKVL